MEMEICITHISPLKTFCRSLHRAQQPGLCTTELGVIFRQWLCQRGVWAGQAADGGREQVAVQKQGAW